MINKYKLIVWLVIFQALDIITTAIGYWVFNARELNPLINHFPMWFLMIMKVVGITFVVFVLIKRIKYPWVHKLLLALSIPAVVWNTINILAELIL